MVGREGHVSRLSFSLPGRTIIKDSRYFSNINLFRLISIEVIGQSLNHEI